MCWEALLGSELTTNPHPWLANFNFPGFRHQEHRVGLAQVSQKSFLQKLPRSNRKTMLQPDRLSSSPGCRMGTANPLAKSSSASPAQGYLLQDSQFLGCVCAVCAFWRGIPQLPWLSGCAGEGRIWCCLWEVPSRASSQVCWFCLLGDDTLQKLFWILHGLCNASPIQ